MLITTLLTLNLFATGEGIEFITSPRQSSHVLDCIQEALHNFIPDAALENFAKIIYNFSICAPKNTETSTCNFIFTFLRDVLCLRQDYSETLFDIQFNLSGHPNNTEKIKYLVDITLYKALGQLTFNNPRVVDFYFNNDCYKLFDDPEKFGYSKESGERPELMNEIKFLIGL